MKAALQRPPPAGIRATLAATRAGRLAAPAVFGMAILAAWELAVRALDISPVILPAPTAIAGVLTAEADVLWPDFRQTVLKGALPGYMIGCLAALATALAIDRSPFLQRGLLPLGNFAAATPIVGAAPILVGWFGFGWQSKAAVVVVMVFFPMLVNTMQGLAAATGMQRDLMRTWSAGYWQTLLKLRLPAAMPFICSGLRVATTLALIGAIVAEYFGSPTIGLGFRISTSAGALAIDMVWAGIAVAALAGVLFYGAVALLERRIVFWRLPPGSRGRSHTL